MNRLHVLGFYLEIPDLCFGLSRGEAGHARAGTDELLHPAGALVPHQLHVPLLIPGEVQATVRADVGALGPPPPRSPGHHLLPVLPEGGEGGEGVQAVQEGAGGEGGPGGGLRHGGGQGAPVDRRLVLLHHVLVPLAHLRVVLLEEGVGGGGRWGVEWGGVGGAGAGELLHQAILHMNTVDPLPICDVQIRVSLKYFVIEVLFTMRTYERIVINFYMVRW